MTQPHDLGEVYTRLSTRYPQADDSLVHCAVDEAHSRLSDSRMTDFLPLLVERSAGKTRDLV
ncbi:three-helix bundle dimerization domain-containing protein [Rhodococcoides fascians]|uniref:three-helix bundle dimerization domain-containing protein n=1 Tax=Rhodococcoides fascians TaxID=1828 RepID=UPI0035302775